MYAGTYDNDATCTNSQRKDDVTVRDDATSENCVNLLMARQQCSGHHVG